MFQNRDSDSEVVDKKNLLYSKFELSKIIFF